MTTEEAIRILDPETTWEALAEIEYYNGFSGKVACVQAVSDACVLAVAALREQEERKNLKVVDFDQVNKTVKDKPMTNADRIRSMSLDEMAVFLLSPADLCGQCQGTGEFCTGYPSNNDCRCVNAVKKWLQQPTEGTPSHSSFEDKTESGLLEED